MRHTIGSAMWLILPLACACAPGGIEGIEVRENPNNTLSCYVSWATTTPASSRVEFGPAGSYQYYVEDQTLTTDHEVLLLGMHPQATYDLRASAIDEEGTEFISEELVFETGAVPFSDLVVEVTTVDEDRMEPGWTLINLAFGAAFAPTTAVMFDNGGEPVWYYHDETPVRADWVATLVDETRVVMGGAITAGSHPFAVDLAGDVIWEGPEQPYDPMDLEPWTMHHEFEELPDGDYVTLRYGKEGAVFYDIIDVFDASGESTWTWHAADHIEGAQSQYYWGNAAQIDRDNGHAYYSAHTDDSVYCIDMASSEVLWKLGWDGDFERDPDAEVAWFERAHAPELLPDGNLLIYDNGFTHGYTRVVEYELDTQAMTSRIAWEYPPSGVDDFWVSSHLGDADRLANGNTLIGAPCLKAAESISHITEVTADGDKVWEMSLTGPGDELAGFYRAQRVPKLVGAL